MPSKKSTKALSPDPFEEKKKARLQRKLQLIKERFERDEIRSFEDIFTIFSPSPLGKLINVHFYRFGDKIADPGKFTYNDIIRLSNLLQVEFDIIDRFIVRLLKDPARVTEKEHKILFPHSARSISPSHS